MLIILKQTQVFVNNKTFVGCRDGNGYARRVVVEGRLRGFSGSLQHVFKHSPYGFEWGYSGSGPLDLAYAILYNIYGPDIAEDYYKALVVELVSRLPRDPNTFWKVTEEQIKKWLHSGKTHKIAVVTGQTKW